MNKFFYSELDKQQFPLSLNLTFGFIMAAILCSVLSDAALFIFHSYINGYSLLHIVIFKGSGFLLTGVVFYYLQRTQQVKKDPFQQEFFRKNQNPMWICHSKTLKLLEVNEAAANAFGYSAQELLAMNLDDLRLSDEHLTAKPGIKEQRFEPSGQQSIQCKDGSTIKVELAYFHISYKNQEAGLFIGNSIIEPTANKKFIDDEFVQQINDRIAGLILAKKELEIRNREINATNDELINLSNLLQSANKKLAAQSSATIQQKNEQFKRIFDQVSDCVWSFDLKGKGEDFVNTSAMDLFGIPEEKIIDCPNFWIEFIHPVERELVIKKLNILETHDETEFSYRMLNPRKETKTFHQKINIIRDQKGKAVRMECIGWPK